MAHLGDFGQASEREVDSFGWFGTQVRVADTFGELVFSDWGEEFGGLDESDPKAFTAVKNLLRRTVHVEDFEEFWQLAVANHQTTENLLALIKAILEAQTERPTQQPAVSSAGPVTIGPSSAAVSSSPVVRRLEASGRPDLALVHVQAQEAQARRAV